MPRTVYGSAVSPFYRKVLVTLNEKGLDYEVEALVPIPKTPELLAMNPLGKIPILKEDDLVLPDSSVIAAYLERSHPESPSIYPSDPATLGRALFLEEYADTGLADAIGGLVFQTFVRVHFLSEEPDAEIVAQLEQEKIPACFDYLDSQIEGDTLLDDFGIADIAVGAQLQSLTLLQREIDASRWPRLAAYAARLFSRPSFQKAIS